MKNRNITLNTPLRAVEILTVAVLLICALLLGVMINTELFGFAIVQDVSMQETLFEGERLFISKTAYTRNMPERGDIVVFLHGEPTGRFLARISTTLIDLVSDKKNPARKNRYVKRVIGLPGDRIKVADGHIYVNGAITVEEYVYGETSPHRISGGVVVPEDSIFVMGDNRPDSFDSRQFGFVGMSSIEGRAVFRFAPLKKFTVFRK